MQEPVVKRKPKKRVVHVNQAQPAAAIKISKNKAIANPRTGTFDWGQFPETDVDGYVFEAGPIRLRYGEHRGPNNGYGLAHIFEAHFKTEEADTPFAAMGAIADFLFSIICEGAQIFYEYGVGRAGEKTTVFMSSKGTVIVERRLDGNNNVFYSIVTAFPSRRVHGELVGVLGPQDVPQEVPPQE
jgi:hypothetical protein